MCGIAGIFNYGGDNAIDHLLLQQMTAVLDHRGPDGQGFYCSSGVGLGHRRLAIVDIPVGAQPPLQRRSVRMRRVQWRDFQLSIANERVDRARARVSHSLRH